MNLQKRINKLREDGKQVYITHRSLVTFDGYHADEAARNFWLGACIFVVVTLLAVWLGSYGYFHNQEKANPALASSRVQIMEAERKKEQQKFDNDRAKEKQQAELTAKDKAQYVQSCKDAGKAPGNMSDYHSNWECK